MKARNTLLVETSSFRPEVELADAGQGERRSFSPSDDLVAVGCLRRKLAVGPAVVAIIQSLFEL